MNYLYNIKKHALDAPENIAIFTSQGQMSTYGQLWAASEAIAQHLETLDITPKQPVVVYGHKDPLMVAAFHGCLKAGHAYVPVDMFSVPSERAASIISQLNCPVVIATEPLPEVAAEQPCTVIERAQLDEIVAAGGTSNEESWVDGEDLAYLIFTSGSTGTPKGVQITANCIDNFTPWALSLGAATREGAVFLNQAPWSFDLSVYELAQAFWSGSSIYCLTHETQSSMKAQMEALATSKVSIWVSTPSFAEMCLSDKTFDEQVLPNLSTFLFCGEVLNNGTAERLQQRFSKAEVVNSYGPTESTVAVTATIVTPAMARAAEPLSVGVARKGTRIRIVDEAGNDVAPGEYGEIVIEGDTVALGYLNRPEQNAAAFGTAVLDDGREVRSYRTGDEGRLDADGNLHVRGRLDLQIKMNGFRIELGEIEKCMLDLPQVKAVCVVPAYKEGRINHLVAHVVSSGPREQSDFREGVAIKDALKEGLPHYMIPRKVKFHEQLPMTGNGKIDRKALQA